LKIANTAEGDGRRAKGVVVTQVSVVERARSDGRREIDTAAVVAATVDVQTVDVKAPVSEYVPAKAAGAIINAKAISKNLGRMQFPPDTRARNSLSFRAVALPPTPLTQALPEGMAEAGSGA
jgi:hypothetical protein